MKTFRFTPADYSVDYQRHGYVHIRGGLEPDFLLYAQQFHEREKSALAEFEFKGKKQQFLFEFAQGSDWPEGVKDAVAQVTGLDRTRLTLCERHIKAYDPAAAATPPPHKDRLASEVATGIPLFVASGSRVVLYPDDELTINPFNSTALWRDSLDEERLPERVLEGKRVVELDVEPGDVLMFRGSSIYHERQNPGGTVILYLKFNAMRLDPLGEDSTSSAQRERSLELLAASDDAELLGRTCELSPRLHRVSRHYTRLHWKEVIQAYVTGFKEFGLSEDELRILQITDGGRTVAEVIRRLGVPEPLLAQYAGVVRRLVRLQAIDLTG